MQSDYGILDTDGLLAVAAITITAVLLWIREGVRRQRLNRLGLPPSHSTRFGNVFLPLLGPLLLSLALFRPYWGSAEFDLTVPGDDYMFVVDVSRSMLVKDLGPTRIELAKRKMTDLLTAFTKAGVGHRFGITLFAGDGYLFCPMTADTAVVRQFTDSITPEMVTSYGSNVEAGIRTALERFSASRSKTGRVLLISDGEDDELALQSVIESIKKAALRVDVLGVGTSAGGPIQLENGTFVRDRGGQTVVSHLNEASLRAIAQAGDGIYVQSTIGDQDITALVSAGAAEGTESTTKRRMQTYGELGSWLALMASLVMIFQLRSSRNPAYLRAAILFIALPLNVSAQERGASSMEIPATGARAGYENYLAGNFKEAASAYERALKDDPSNPELKQGYASALFKSGRIADAQKIFEQLALDAKSGKEYFDNQYNNANALLALEKFQEAIDGYTKALDVKPNDVRAEANRQIAKALLEERSRKPTPTPTPRPTPTSAALPSPEPSPSPSSTNAPTPQPTTSSGEQTPTPISSTPPSADPTAGGTPSPSSTAGSSTTPTPAATAQGEQTAVQTPDAKETESSAGDAPQNPTPSPAAEPNSLSSPTPAQNDERLKEALDDDGVAPTPVIPTSTVTTSSTPEDHGTLSQSEADAWLQSLPDSPLLVRRHRGQLRPGKQTW